MQSHQLLHKCEPDASALVGPPALTFDTMKSLENARQFRFRDPHAAVPHYQDCVYLLRFNSHLYAAIERELESIGQEVEHDLFPHLAVYVD